MKSKVVISFLIMLTGLHGSSAAPKTNNSPLVEKNSKTTELKSEVTSIFKIGETESEILHSSDLSRDDLNKILNLIIQNNVHYAKSLPETHPKIDVRFIESIRLSRIISVNDVFEITEKYRNPKTTSIFYKYKGYIKNEVLYIVRAYGMHIN